MTNTVTENQFIEKLADQLKRSPMQMNKLHESDAEIIRFSYPSSEWLAVSTDSIVEEIVTGLYNDPYLVGWVTVMATLSDLAAVGAKPLGVLISEVLPRDYPDSSLVRLQQGIQNACALSDTYVLGGDVNSGEQLTMTGTAVGTVRNARFLSRIGCRPGDVLYSTNFLGTGNAFALSRFGGATDQRIEYRPQARLREGQCLSGIATSCMDTSDGVIATLDQLMRLNHHGFELDTDWESTLHPDAKEIAQWAGLHPWLLFAGQHGEFELLFTISQNLEKSFLRRARENNWHPLRLGKVIEEPAIYLPLYGDRVALDTGCIRNLAAELNGDIKLYIRRLLAFDYTIQKGAFQRVSE